MQYQVFVQKNAVGEASPVEHGTFMASVVGVPVDSGYLRADGLHPSWAGQQAMILNRRRLAPKRSS